MRYSADNFYNLSANATLPRPEKGFPPQQHDALQHMVDGSKFGIFKVAYGDMMSKIEISRRTREKGCCYGDSNPSRERERLA
jgi:hypothetical protein